MLLISKIVDGEEQQIMRAYLGLGELLRRCEDRVSDGAAKILDHVLLVGGGLFGAAPGASWDVGHCSIAEFKRIIR